MSSKAGRYAIGVATWCMLVLALLALTACVSGPRVTGLEEACPGTFVVLEAELEPEIICI